MEQCRFLYKVVFLFLDSCRPSLTHALAWPRLTNHSLPPKWRWFVHNIISPGLPPLKKIAADKHVFAKLPLVTPFISNWTRLTAFVCMKVRFEAKVTRGFSLSPRRFRDSLSPLSLDLFREEKSRKTFGARVSGAFFLPEIFEKISFDPYNFRITRLSARKSEQMKNF